jgi:hypothetical protein
MANNRAFVRKVIWEALSNSITYQDAALEAMLDGKTFDELSETHKLALLMSSQDMERLKKIDLLKIFKERGNTFGHLEIKARIKDEGDLSSPTKTVLMNAGREGWLMDHVFQDGGIPYATLRFKGLEVSDKAAGGGNHSECHVALGDLIAIGIDAIDDEFYRHERRQRTDRDEFLRRNGLG